MHRLKSHWFAAVVGAIISVFVLYSGCLAAEFRTNSHQSLQERSK